MRVLVVDLNNFARYPTIAVGYLAALLRRDGVAVDVFSPLSCGVAGVVRESRPGRLSLIKDILGYRSAVSTHTAVKAIRSQLAARHLPALAAEHGKIVAEFERRLQRDQPDVVLISTYLMYRDLCAELAAAARRAAIPVLLGGAYFAQREVANEWITIDNVAGIVGGEVEPHLRALVSAVSDGEDLAAFPGVWTRDSANLATGRIAPPLKDLDALPFPDYVDFPWSRYPNRIIPLITGRGCAWGACTFCSDVTSTAGRTFRSRSPGNVLDELRYQSARHDTRLLAFTDLKLNSNLAMWMALGEQMQSVLPGARWIGAVHVGRAQPTGLSMFELRRARAAGMVRVTTGLESGSQRVLDLMQKGSHLETTSEFLRNASTAGISCRTTMIVGYPGEEASDVLASARFLEDHHDSIERVMLNRFQIMTGARIHRLLEARGDHYPAVTQLTVNHRLAQVDHHYSVTEQSDYRRAVTRLLGAVHAINSKPLREDAREFEGVM
jgi:anaerobic magnesium-protoporphyrin IX monomethyl ester cyclase